MSENDKIRHITAARLRLAVAVLVKYPFVRARWLFSSLLAARLRLAVAVLVKYPFVHARWLFSSLLAQNPPSIVVKT